MKEKNKKRGFLPDITVGTPGLDEAGLRDLAKGRPQEFMRVTKELIDEGTIQLSDIRDLRKLYHSLSDVQVTANFNDLGRTRAITTSAFPLLTGNLVVAAINAAYEQVPTIGEELVKEMNDNKRSTMIAAIHSEDLNKDGVKEGEEFPEIGASEEKYEIRHKRNGRRLSITAEMIEENEIADIVNRVNALGEIAADTIEEQTLSRVCDQYGSASSPAEPYVYRPNGSGTQLYNSTANNPGARAPSGTRVTNNALVDTTDLDAARTVLAAMKNNRGKRIALPMSRCILLVPDALLGTASKIMGSELEPGTVNELNNWGPRGRFRPIIVSSPKLDDISTTAWYLGDFRNQFTRKWKLKFEYVTLGDNTESYLRNRIKFQARIAWDCEVGALDYVKVVQNLSGTTAP